MLEYVIFSLVTKGNQTFFIFIFFLFFFNYYTKIQDVFLLTTSTTLSTFSLVGRQRFWYLL